MGSIVTSICRNEKSKKQSIQQQQLNKNVGSSINIPPDVEKEEETIKMRSEYWKINNNAYQQQKWAIKFSKVNSIDARYLQIMLNNYANIIKDIKHLNCSHLKALYIRGNDIVTIEALTFLDASNLCDLDIRSNHITQIKCIRKCNFTLDHLFINNNPLVQFTGLSAIKFNRVVKRNYVTSYYQTWNNISSLNFYDLSQFAKAQPKFIFQNLFINNNGNLSRLNKILYQAIETKKSKVQKI